MNKKKKKKLRYCSEDKEKMSSSKVCPSDLGNDNGSDTMKFQLRPSSINFKYIKIENYKNWFQIEAGNFLSKVESIELKHIHNC